LFQNFYYVVVTNIVFCHFEAIQCGFVQFWAEMKPRFLPIANELSLSHPFPRIRRMFSGRGSEITVLAWCAARVCGWKWHGV